MSKSNMTCQELASILEVDQRTVERWLSATSAPRRGLKPTLAAMAKELGCKKLIPEEDHKMIELFAQVTRVVLTKKAFSKWAEKLNQMTLVERSTTTIGSSKDSRITELLTNGPNQRLFKAIHDRFMEAMEFDLKSDVDLQEYKPLWQRVLDLEPALDSLTEEEYGFAASWVSHAAFSLGEDHLVETLSKNVAYNENIRADVRGDAWNNLGQLFISLGLEKEAEEALNGAVFASKNLASVHYNRLCLASMQKNERMFLSELGKLKRIDPTISDPGSKRGSRLKIDPDLQYGRDKGWIQKGFEGGDLNVG